MKQDQGEGCFLDIPKCQSANGMAFLRNSGMCHSQPDLGSSICRKGTSQCSVDKGHERGADFPYLKGKGTQLRHQNDPELVEGSLKQNRYSNNHVIPASGRDPVYAE